MKKRRIGAVSKKSFADGATFVAAGIGGSIVANMVSGSLFPTMTGTTKGIVLAAAGIGLAAMSRDRIIQGVGTGIAINGGVTLLGPSGLNVISGIGNSRLMKRGAAPQGSRRLMLQQGVIGRNGQRLSDGVLGVPGSSDFSANADFR